MFVMESIPRVDKLETVLMTKLPRIASLESRSKSIDFRLHDLECWRKDVRMQMVAYSLRIGALEKRLDEAQGTHTQVHGDGLNLRAHEPGPPGIMSLAAPLAEGTPKYDDDDFLLATPRPLPAPAPAITGSVDMPAEAAASPQEPGPQ